MIEANSFLPSSFCPKNPEPATDTNAVDISISKIVLRDVSLLVPISRLLNLLSLIVSRDDVITDKSVNLSSFTFSDVTVNFALLRLPFFIVNFLFTVAV